MHLHNSISTAKDLLNNEEKAFVVFTRGDHFHYDINGNGETGLWVAGAISLSMISKVIIYKKDEITESNHVFIANYLHWSDSPLEGRKILHFSGLEDKGTTASNWFEFGGSAWSPTFYIR